MRVVLSEGTKQSQAQLDQAKTMIEGVEKLNALIAQLAKIKCRTLHNLYDRLELVSVKMSKIPVGNKNN